MRKEKAQTEKKSKSSIKRKLENKTDSVNNHQTKGDKQKIMNTQWKSARGERFRHVKMRTIS